MKFQSSPVLFISFLQICVGVTCYIEYDRRCFFYCYFAVFLIYPYCPLSLNGFTVNIIKNTEAKNSNNNNDNTTGL